MTRTRVRLGDVLEVQSGFAFKTEFFTQSEGVPLIRIRDLPNAETKINYSGPFRDEFLVRNGDYLIGMDGAFECYRWKGERALLNQRVCRLRNFHHTIDPEYVHFGIQRELREIENTTAFVTVKHISAGQIANINFPCPPLSEQRRIVDILSRAESIVRLRREAQKKAAELIPALFTDLFGDPATNPKGWAVDELPNVLYRAFKNGLYLPKELYANADSAQGVEMVHMSDAFYGEVKRGELRRVLASEKQIDEYGLTRNDLLVARRSLTFDGAAKLCGLPASNDPLLFESSFIRLSPDLNKVRTQYLLYYLNNDNTRRAHVLSRITGITISGINQAALSHVPVMIPPLAAQDSFVRHLDAVRAIQSQQTTATTQAEAAFNALLAQVFAPV